MDLSRASPPSDTTSIPYAAAHYMSPATQGIPQQGYRECDSCGTPESSSTGHILKVCAGCKFAAYCSKTCQRNDWPSHKPVCNLTAATICASRAEGRLREGQYPTPNLAKYLRRFCVTHAPLLAWVAYQALDLKHKPSTIDTSGLLLDVNYAALAPLHFTLSGVHIVDRTYLTMNASPLITQEVDRREARARRAGGIGCAVILVQCGDMAEVIPIEFDHPERMTSWEVRDDWEEVLIWNVSTGRGNFTPPLVPGAVIPEGTYWYGDQ